MSRSNSITPEEAAEFRGFFFGEGHVDLSRSARGASLLPRLRITLRDDDAAILYWCRDLFGGNLSRRVSVRSLCWQLTGVDAVGRALGVLEAGRIPSKKRPEVAMLREALSLIPPRGKHIDTSAATRLREIHAALIAERSYAGPRLEVA